MDRTSKHKAALSCVYHRASNHRLASKTRTRVALPSPELRQLLSSTTEEIILHLVKKIPVARAFASERELSPQETAHGFLQRCFFDPTNHFTGRGQQSRVHNVGTTSGCLFDFTQDNLQSLSTVGGPALAFVREMNPDVGENKEVIQLDRHSQRKVVFVRHKVFLGGKTTFSENYDKFEVFSREKNCIEMTIFNKRYPPQTPSRTPQSHPRPRDRSSVPRDGTYACGCPTASHQSVGTARRKGRSLGAAGSVPTRRRRCCLMARPRMRRPRACQSGAVWLVSENSMGRTRLSPGQSHQLAST